MHRGARSLISADLRTSQGTLGQINCAKASCRGSEKRRYFGKYLSGTTHGVGQKFTGRRIWLRNHFRCGRNASSLYDTSRRGLNKFRYGPAFIDRSNVKMKDSCSCAVSRCSLMVEIFLRKLPYPTTHSAMPDCATITASRPSFFCTK